MVLSRADGHQFHPRVATLVRLDDRSPWLGSAWKPSTLPAPESLAPTPRLAIGSHDGEPHIAAQEHAFLACYWSGPSP